MDKQDRELKKNKIFKLGEKLKSKRESKKDDKSKLEKTISRLPIMIRVPSHFYKKPRTTNKLPKSERGHNLDDLDKMKPIHEASHGKGEVSSYLLGEKHVQRINLMISPDFTLLNENEKIFSVVSSRPIPTLGKLYGRVDVDDSDSDRLVDWLIGTDSVHLTSPHWLSKVECSTITNSMRSTQKSFDGVKRINAENITNYKSSSTENKMCGQGISLAGWNTTNQNLASKQHNKSSTKGIESGTLPVNPMIYSLNLKEFKQNVSEKDAKATGSTLNDDLTVAWRKITERLKQKCDGATAIQADELKTGTKTCSAKTSPDYIKAANYLNVSSYVECPSEVLQKTTNFENIEEFKAIRSSSPRIDAATLCHQRTNDANNTVERDRSARSLNTNRRKQWAITNETNGFNNSAPKPWRHRTSMHRICRKRCYFMWRKSARRWQTCSPYSPNTNKRLQEVHYFLHRSNLWKNANLPKNHVVCQETGTDSEATEQKSTSTSSVCISSRFDNDNKASHSGHKHRFKCLCPSMFSFLHSSKPKSKRCITKVDQNPKQDDYCVEISQKCFKVKSEITTNRNLINISRPTTEKYYINDFTQIKNEEKSTSLINFEDVTMSDQCTGTFGNSLEKSTSLWMLRDEYKEQTSSVGISTSFKLSDSESPTTDIGVDTISQASTVTKSFIGEIANVINGEKTKGFLTDKETENSPAMSAKSPTFRDKFTTILTDVETEKTPESSVERVYRNASTSTLAVEEKSITETGTTKINDVVRGECYNVKISVPEFHELTGTVSTLTDFDMISQNEEDDMKNENEVETERNNYFFTDSNITQIVNNLTEKESGPETKEMSLECFPAQTQVRLSKLKITGPNVFSISSRTQSDNSMPTETAQSGTFTYSSNLHLRDSIGNHCRQNSFTKNRLFEFDSNSVYTATSFIISDKKSNLKKDLGVQYEDMVGTTGDCPTLPGSQYTLLSVLRLPLTDSTLTNAITRTVNAVPTSVLHHNISPAVTSESQNHIQPVLKTSDTSKSIVNQELNKINHATIITTGSEDCSTEANHSLQEHEQFEKASRENEQNCTEDSLEMKSLSSWHQLRPEDEHSEQASRENEQNSTEESIEVKSLSSWHQLRPDLVSNPVPQQRSACVLTSRCFLPDCAPCNYARNSHKQQACRFVFGEPVCAVHRQCNNGGVQTMFIPDNEIRGLEPLAKHTDTSVVTSIFDVIPNHYEKLNNSPRGVLSPTVYKALYETTKLIAKENVTEPPVKDVSGLSPLTSTEGHQELVEKAPTSVAVTGSEEKPVKDNLEIDSDTESTSGECIKTQLVTSCRYYSNLLTERLGRVKEMWTKRLASSDEDEDSVPDKTSTDPYNNVITIKPPQEIACRNVQIKGNGKAPPFRCTLSPTVNEMNICESDKEKLRSLYILLSAKEHLLNKNKRIN